ncbi:molybdopterin-dependent oxidoreductase [Nocardioides sp.]|uniref:molybdopterin-dependent oxidoreductase n=1 Tax=Nocardioides sp. TaxID=35761 RepID=UPI003514823B
MRSWWSVLGILVGLTGLAVSYAVASLLHVRESPVVAVAEGVTALTPGAVVEWAISTFGTDDKLVLTIGIVVILLVVFALLGRAARDRRWVALAGFGVLAAIGLVAVLAKPSPGISQIAPLLAGLLTWSVALTRLSERLERWEASAGTDDQGRTDPASAAESRRGFLVLSLVTAGIAAGGGLIGRVAGSGRRRAEESRRLLRIEGVTAPQVPAGADRGLPGVAPWQTPADDFYLIDTAYIKPTIAPADWRLRIHGEVENEIELTYADLVGRQVTEDWITLNCVSNEIGGELVGNAWWSGVRLADILAEAKPKAGADAVLQTSDDGWTCGTPLAALTDDRNAMLAVAMNGEPLPIEHGFPVRTIVPGLYGYVSATKWVVDMEVTRFDRIEAYWTQKGWGEFGPVKMASRIEVPGRGVEVPAGEVVCAGHAWKQHTGIEGVEVQVDDGRWQPAQIAPTAGIDTWVQWWITLDVKPGEHTVRVRAISREGEVQTGAIADVLPDGATGWHTVPFTATA